MEERNERDAGDIGGDGTAALSDATPEEPGKPDGACDGTSAGQAGAPAAAVPWWRGVGEFVVAFAVMILVILGIRQFVMEPYQIPSGSMLETIQLEDRVFAEKVTVELGVEPKAGQIVTFKSLTSSDTLIKRVIAVGGQTIDLRDGVLYIDGVAQDESYTLGKATTAMSAYDKQIYPSNQAGVSFPYTIPQDYRIETAGGQVVATAGQTVDLEGATLTVDGVAVSATGRLNLTRDDITYPYTVPEGYIWCMGDNRTNSADSRVFGAVPVSNVTGVAVFRYWPVFYSGEPVEIDMGWFTFTAYPLTLALGPLD